VEMRCAIIRFKCTSSARLRFLEEQVSILPISFNMKDDAIVADKLDYIRAGFTRRAFLCWEGREAIKRTMQARRQ